MRHCHGGGISELGWCIGVERCDINVYGGHWDMRLSIELVN